MKNYFFALMLIFVSSCKDYNISEQSLFFECVSSYRQQCFPKINENDSLFFLILLSNDNGDIEINMSANRFEIPYVVSMPTFGDTCRSNNLFCGYSEFDNNFLFYYCENHSSKIDGFLKGIKIQYNIKENIPLAKYQTHDWNIDSQIWDLHLRNDSLFVTY